MKRWIALILGLTLCFAVMGCKKEPSVPQQTSQNGYQQTTDIEGGKPDRATPLLYQVTDGAGNVIWLFGSIHVGRDDFYPLPDYVIDAFEGSDALAVEADILSFENDMSAQMEAITLFLYTDGTTIKDHVSEEVYEAAVKILAENDTYMAMLDYYNASFWSNLIDSCLYLQLDVDTENGIDRHLMELAEETGKEILEVESVMFQYGMLAGFSEELQAYLLEMSVEQYVDMMSAKEELNRMMDLWFSGDEAAFSEYLNAADAFESDEEALLYKEYNDSMIVERNEAMTDYAIDALASGEEVFICVGAAHVVGEGAMAELLAEAGYTVERIS